MIAKAIIPVAGFGTRFLPVTKALPKEMLPVLDKPVVQYIVEEIVASGVKEILFVTGQNKRALEDHFDFLPELEEWLQRTGKEKALAEIRQIASMANFTFIRQKGPYGNGTPVLNAEGWVGGEPFVVVWADEIFVNPEKTRLTQLFEVFEKYHSPVLTVVDTDDHGTKKYGIIEGEEVESGIIKVMAIAEKPGPESTRSRLASVGGYVLTPEIFSVLRKTPVRNQELWLADALAILAAKQSVYAKKVVAEYYDTGSVFGWLEANIKFGLRDPGIGKDLSRLLKQI